MYILCSVSVRGVEKSDHLLALEFAGLSFDLAFSSYFKFATLKAALIGPSKPGPVEYALVIGSVAEQVVIPGPVVMALMVVVIPGPVVMALMVVVILGPMGMALMVVVIPAPVGMALVLAVMAELALMVMFEVVVMTLMILEPLVMAEPEVMALVKIEQLVMHLMQKMEPEVVNALVLPKVPD